jgi:predicted nucleotidyltransferase
MIPHMGISADALFTKTQQRVLGILFSQTDRSFYANEIISLAGSGSGAVQRELMRLEAAALVRVHRIGNQKHYQANPDAPIFAELKGIVLKTFGVADVVCAALHPFWVQIDFAFIYGSVAKGTEHGDSDVDLLVVGTVGSNAQLLEALLPAQTQLGRPVNLTTFTPDEFRQRLAAGRSFIIRVLQQPKIFIKGGPDDIARISSPG